MNRAIIDLETGGFSITNNGVCEIGVLIINDQYEVIHKNNWIIKPYFRPDGDELVSYKDDAMAIHGISMDEIENGFDVDDACEQLNVKLKYYQVQTVIGHNFIVFDLPRLQYLFNRFFSNTKFDYDILDTLQEIRERTLKLESYSLESLCKHFGITNNNSHRALGDCYATLELLKKFGL